MEPKEEEIEELTSSMLFSYLAIFTALVALMTVAAIPLPPPLANLNLAPLAIYVLSILLPIQYSFFVVAFGSALGVWYLTAIYGYPLIFIPGIFFVRGVMAAIASALRKYNEILAMIAAVIWETVAFLVIDYYLYGPAAFIDVFIIIDAVWIIPAMYVLPAIRQLLGRKYIID